MCPTLEISRTGTVSAALTCWAADLPKQGLPKCAAELTAGTLEFEARESLTDDEALTEAAFSLTLRLMNLRT